MSYDKKFQANGPGQPMTYIAPVPGNVKRKPLNLSDTKMSSYVEADFCSNLIVPSESLETLQKTKVYAYKEEIAQFAKKTDVMIFEAPTGAGKSTIIPIIVGGASKQLKMLIVLPTRSSCFSNGMRVRELVGDKTGSQVGICTGTTKSYSTDSKIVFCTPGIAKIMLSFANVKFTHIFIDEIHKRGQDISFILEKCRLTLRNCSHTKLMFATATLGGPTEQRIREYFNDCRQPGPTVIDKHQIQSVTDFRIDEISKLAILIASGVVCFANELEEAVQFPEDQCNAVDFCTQIVPTQREVDKVSPNQREEVMRLYRREYCEKKDAELEVIEHVVKYLLECKIKKLLIFVSGIDQINKLEARIKKLDGAHVGCMHSELSFDVNVAWTNKYNVFISTNVAETSTTIVGLEVVLDLGIEKRPSYRHSLGSSRLDDFPICPNAMMQRRGRTGRTCDGFYVKFYDEDFPETSLQNSGPLYQEVVEACREMNTSAPQYLVPFFTQQIFDRVAKIELEDCVSTLKRKGFVHTQTLVPTEIALISNRLPFSAHFMDLPILGAIFRVLSKSLYITAAIAGRQVYNYRTRATANDNPEAIADEDALQLDPINAEHVSIFSEQFKKLESHDLIAAACLEEAMKKGKKWKLIKFREKNMNEAKLVLSRCFNVVRGSVFMKKNEQTDCPNLNLNASISMCRALLIMSCYPMFGIHPYNEQKREKRKISIAKYTKVFLACNQEIEGWSEYLYVYTKCFGQTLEGTRVSPSMFAMFAGLFDDTVLYEEKDFTIRFMNADKTLQVAFGLPSLDAFNEMRLVRENIKNYIMKSCVDQDWWDSEEAKAFAADVASRAIEVDLR